MTPIAPGADVKIWLIDFDDSFTYNICSELYEMGLAVEVVHWSLWDKLFKRLEGGPQRKALILGPGPGHPSEYDLKGLHKLLERDDLFVCGVCLGHQLIWQQMGLSIERCQEPVHGQQIEIKVPEWFRFLPPHLCGQSVRVQRYNSLCVVPDSHKIPSRADILVVNNELLAASFGNTLTYQFHPESVGTSFRHSFFRPILDFLVY